MNLSPNKTFNNNFLDAELEFEDDFIGTELTSSVQKEIDLGGYNSIECLNSDMLDPDYDKELGGSKIFTTQDMIDQEFKDIATLNLVQVVGDDHYGLKVVVFFACRLPPITEINLSRLWMYVVKTLRQFVSNDYSLIYFHHGLTTKNNPGIKFMLNAYRQIDRDFKKNLKNIYIVHPTNLLKFIINALLPVFSAKVRKKIIKIHRLKDLEKIIFLNQLALPEQVKSYDAKLDSPNASLHSFQDSAAENASHSVFYSYLPEAQFHVTLQHIRQYNPNHAVPPIMEECIQYLRKPECIQCEGIFRRCPSKILLEESQLKIQRGEKIDFNAIGQPHLASVILKTFLRSLKEPVMTFDLYHNIIQIHNCTMDEAIDNLRVIVSEMLPEYNYGVLKYLIDFLLEVSQYSDENKMTASNLANVFAPSLVWSSNETSLTVIHIFIKFTSLLMTHNEKIFVRGDNDS